MLQRNNNNTHTHSISENIPEADKYRAMYFHSLLLANREGKYDLELKQMLEERKNLANAKDLKGLTPLQSLMNQLANNVCPLDEFEKSILLLIANDADISVKDKMPAQDTIAHHLVLKNKNGVNNAVIKKLCNEKGATFLNAKNGNKLTALQELMISYNNGACSSDDYRETVLLLAELGVDLALKDAHQETLMHQLILSNKDGQNDLLIKKLHEKNNELIHLVNGQGLTPLQSLMQLYSRKAIDLKAFKKAAMMLVEMGANLEVLSSAGSTLLHLLVVTNRKGMNNAEIAAVLKANNELIHCKNTNGLTPLQLLLEQFANSEISLKDFKGTAFILAEAGADFSFPNVDLARNAIRRGELGKVDGFLHQLVWTNQEGANNKGVNDEDIARFLKMFPDLVDVGSGWDGHSPLVSLMKQFDQNKCSLKSFKRTANILLRHGADPLAAGHKSMLCYLVQTNTAGINDKEIAELVKVRPDLMDVANKEGYTPIQYLISQPGVSVEAVKKLLDLGVNLRAKYKELSLLELACKAGNLGVAKLLIERGMTVEGDIDVDNVHHCFADHKNEELWDWLHTKGVDFTKRDLNNQTLLHTAVLSYNSSLVKWLIKKNVNLNAMDSNGTTPLNVAEALKDKQTELYLKRAGAKMSNVRHLFDAIQGMRRYGESLKYKDAPKAKVAVDLAEQLQLKANELLTLHDGLVDLPTFKKQFDILSHTKDQEMSVYRESWSKILLNLALALTGIGLVAIVGKLVYSDMMTGRPTFFGQHAETTRETKLAEVRSAALKVGG